MLLKNSSTGESRYFAKGEDAFGFTRARIAAHAIILWLGGLVVLVMVAGILVAVVLRGRPPEGVLAVLTALYMIGAVALRGRDPCDGTSHFLSARIDNPGQLKKSDDGWSDLSGGNEVVDDEVSVTCECRGPVSWVEVLDVVGPDRDLLVARRSRHLVRETLVEEMIAVSLIISMIMNWYNKRIALRER